MKQQYTKHLKTKITVLVLALSMIITSLYLPVGALAISSDDEGTDNSIEETTQYKLIDVNDIAPGKEYIMLWNKALSDNSGDYYALTSNYSTVKPTAVNSSYFSPDKSTLSIPKSEDTQTYTWRTVYNTGSNPVTGYLFQDDEESG